MFCASCGKPGRPGTKFCPFCGAPSAPPEEINSTLPEQLDTGVQPAADVDHTPERPTCAFWRSGRNRYMALVVVLCVVVAGLAFGLLLPGHRGPMSAAEQDYLTKSDAIAQSMSSAYDSLDPLVNDPSVSDAAFSNAVKNATTQLRQVLELQQGNGRSLQDNPCRHGSDNDRYRKLRTRCREW
jgi:uncharacterized protein HemX